VDHNKQANKISSLDIFNNDANPRTEQQLNGKLPTDPSATLTLTAPDNYIEDKVMAGKLGVLQLLQKRSGDSASVVAASFSAEEESVTLDHIVQNSKLSFWSGNPYGMVSEVKLAAAVTAPLRKRGVSTACLLFDTKGIEPRLGQLMLLVRTPAGLWKITWHSTMDDIYSHKSFFGQVVQTLQFALTKQEKGEVLATTSTSLLSRSSPKKKGKKVAVQQQEAGVAVGPIPTAVIPPLAARSTLTHPHAQTTAATVATPVQGTALDTDGLPPSDS